MDSYAIVETGGMQFRMAPGRQVLIPRVDQREGAKLRFDRVLLISDEKGIEIGQPVLGGVTVVARVVEHGRGPRILVYKRKRRKGYEKRMGHRQSFTRVLVESLDRKQRQKKQEKDPESAEATEGS
ncbi:50S ribosomal protein L21 [Candidatus Fermentibacterales bacterium]|nr:50S ribosomal protein L21 [Candidatus Fermentibacterales bacterium]